MSLVALQLRAGSVSFWTCCNIYMWFILWYCITDYVALSCRIICAWRTGGNLKGSSQHSCLNALRKITKSWLSGVQDPKWPSQITSHKCYHLKQCAEILYTCILNPYTGWSKSLCAPGEQSPHNWWFEDGYHRIHLECGPCYTEHGLREHSSTFQ